MTSIDLFKDLPRVHNKMILLCKTFTAFLADVGTFAGVKFTMRHQMTLQGKRTTALLANKWSLPAMDT